MKPTMTEKKHYATDEELADAMRVSDETGLVICPDPCGKTKEECKHCVPHEKRNSCLFDCGWIGREVNPCVPYKRPAPTTGESPDGKPETNGSGPAKNGKKPKPDFSMLTPRVGTVELTAKFPITKNLTFTGSPSISPLTVRSGYVTHATMGYITESTAVLNVDALLQSPKVERAFRALIQTILNEVVSVGKSGNESGTISTGNRQGKRTGGRKRTGKKVGGKR